MKNVIIFDFKENLKKIGVEEKIINEWLLIRKQKKSVNTETAFEKIKEEIEKSNLHPNEAITISVENSWAGFKNQWLVNLKNKNEQTNNNEKRGAATYNRSKAISEVQTLLSKSI